MEVRGNQVVRRVWVGSDGDVVGECRRIEDAELGGEDHRGLGCPELAEAAEATHHVGRGAFLVGDERGTEGAGGRGKKRHAVSVIA